MSPARGGGPAAEALDVVWTPAELRAVALEGRTAVVVDVLRASTTVTAALEAGARRILPTGTVAEAREAARAASDRDGPPPLKCGERRGRRIDGFDLGNRPGEYRPGVVRGRVLVYTTTNGTRALRRCAGAANVWMGCFRNLGAVVAAAAGLGRPPVVVCAGRRGRVGLDDALCAGHLVRRLASGDGADGRDAPLADGALDALALCAALGEPDARLLGRTAAGRALEGLGFGADLEFAAAVDASDLVPALAGGALVPLEAGAVEAGARGSDGWHGIQLPAEGG